MKYIIVASLAAILCLLGAIPVIPSSAQPLLPHAFYGNVTINGTPAPIGTVVEANGTGVSTGIAYNPITVTEAGKYGGPGLDLKLTVQGNITDGTNLTFYVNNVTAQCYDVQAGGDWLDSYPFKSGNVTELNLRVGPTYNLTVNVTPSGGGNVTVDGTMLSDYPNSTMWYCGTNVTLNATAAGGYIFNHWSGALSGNTTPVNITMDSTKNVTAHFGLIGVTHNLTVNVTPSGGGDIEVNGDAPSSYPYNYTFNAGDLVDLNAVPAGGYSFVNWSGDLSGSTNPTNITMYGNYTITANFEAVPAPGPGPGGGGRAYYLRVNMLGDISKWKISKQGNLLESLQVSSADDKVTISLDKSASCLDKEDNRLSTITISEQTDWPPVPEDYDIIGTAYEFRPAGAEFAPALSLTLGYVDDDVPQYASEEDVYIAYYDATAENWVPLTSKVDTENNIVDAPVGHFTTFAIMGAAVTPTPANFSVTSLDLSSEQVEPGQEVLVTVNVTNIGGCEGSYTLDLTINGEVEQTKTVTLAPSASDTVTFTVIKEEPGSYTISVDGLTKEFSVAAVAPSWLSRYWWIILLVIIAIALVVYFQWRPRRAIRS